MSIHELEFGQKTSPISARCLDSEILAAKQSSQSERLLHKIPAKTFHSPALFPTLIEREPLSERKDELPPYNTIKDAVLVRIVTAISLNEVLEYVSVSGFDMNGEQHEIVISLNTYREEEIDEAIPRIGNKKFAYSETPVYVAPGISRRP